MQRVQGMQTVRDQDAGRSKGHRRTHDPKRSPRVSPSQAKRLEVLFPKRYDRHDDSARDPIEDSLQGIRRPDHEQYRRITHHDFKQIAASF